MAKLNSIIKIEGTIDDLTFYKGQDGYLVKRKSSVSKSRINSDPAFARTRENGYEFGHAASSGKQLRRAIIPLMSDAKDNRVTSRLTRTMSQIKNFDSASARGQRKVAIGINEALAKQALKGFDFNNRALLSSVLLTDFTVNTTTGEITIPNFTPTKNLASPTGATHVSFTTGVLNLNFETNEKDLQISPIVNLEINNSESVIALLPPTVPSGAGTQMQFLKIAFFQEINGIQYPLNNGAFNALQIVEVV